MKYLASLDLKGCRRSSDLIPKIQSLTAQCWERQGQSPEVVLPHPGGEGRTTSRKDGSSITDPGQRAWASMCQGTASAREHPGLGAAAGMGHSHGQCSTTGTQLVHGKESWSIQPGAGRRSASASILWQGNAMLGSKQSRLPVARLPARCPRCHSAGHRSWACFIT